jgi:protein-S-isoprenylcysteine O-methyltransferase Ste14
MTGAAQMSDSGVRFPPPFIYVAGFLVAWALESRVTRIHLVGGDASAASLKIAGLVIAALGFLLVLWGLYTFARAHTGILPMRPATKIVDYGPYSFTRNPMYTGLAIVFLGAALFLNFGWMIVLLPLVMIAVYIFVIRREERYLSAVFPEEYGAYKRRVRRWL